MKILVAAEGTSWESPIANRFEHAVWYLIIDGHAMEKEVYQNLPPHDHNNILLTASRIHCSLIVAGWVNSATARLMQSLNLRLVIARTMRVRDMITRVHKGTVDIADLADFRQGLVIPGVTVRASSIISRNEPSHYGGGTSSMRTSRSQHHLQQYGGRGH
jgi:predicted Fe-Mo cluster-binding NifX family protein